MIILAVFGQPVHHSLSPRIHARFAEEAGLEVVYTAIEAKPGSLNAALTRFAHDGGVGCNITLPLKGEAAALAGSTSKRVHRANAANTLIRDGQGWIADNTDGLGLVADLRRLGLDPAGRRVLLLGAGGAAAGVVAALLAGKPQTLCIANRSVGKALQLAEAHQDLGPVTARSLDAPGTESFDLVLNATSLGHEGGVPALAASLLSEGGALYDLNYGPAAAPLAAWAAEEHIPYADGLGMLVGQAAESFKLWTGYRPAIEPVLEGIRAG
ncbi:MAG: shikimate dehydrogenase [Pseudomonadota bacterium]